MNTMLKVAVAAVVLSASSSALANNDKSSLELNLGAMFSAQVESIQVELVNATKSALEATVNDWKLAFADEEQEPAVTVAAVTTDTKAKAADE
ncbi:hypothetical protein CWE22_00370 [Pseudidiomarina aestuarii]|uniref:Uncharacterized protein n=1 Tax=Pseudidiomarina aestuarii TaxID=624146 RepID=A0A7Z7ET55_9GAMM|nr:hypothetical protein [Pseudidiomarina aestuarii]RUO40702.1 hypothetical protein CWE22_00370 [Pseudidiomarina aestuarii]